MILKDYINWIKEKKPEIYKKHEFGFYRLLIGRKVPLVIKYKTLLIEGRITSISVDYDTLLKDPLEAEIFLDTPLADRLRVKDFLSAKVEFKIEVL